MLKNEDTFRVECVNSISEDSIVSLANLYQPLIGGDGLLLYLTLHAEARHQRVQSTHKHLCRIMNNISLDTLERARLRLEEYNLLRAYMRQGSGHDAWIYHLNTPLPTMDFLSNQIYLSRFRNEVGTKDTDEIVARLGNVGISLQ
jgi:replication initiation and membrane attachment protein DnaB